MNNSPFWILNNRNKIKKLIHLLIIDIKYNFKKKKYVNYNIIK